MHLLSEHRQVLYQKRLQDLSHKPIIALCSLSNVKTFGGEQYSPYSCIEICVLVCSDGPLAQAGLSKASNACLAPRTPLGKLLGNYAACGGRKAPHSASRARRRTHNSATQAQSA